MSIEAMKRIKSLLQDGDKIDSHTISAVVAECDAVILTQQPDNAACGSVQKRLAAQQPATRLPEDVVIGHVTLCKGSNISLLIDHAKRLNNDVERLEALQPQVTLLVNMLESAQQEAQDLHKEVDRLTSTVTPSVPGDDFDLICNAIDKADTITMEGDYMLDSDDCIAVVRVMQVLLSVRAAMLAAK